MKRSMPPAKVNQRNGMWKRGKAPILPVTVLTGFLGSGRNTEIGKDAAVSISCAHRHLPAIETTQERRL